MHIKRKTLLSTFIICAFLLGSLAAPVAALQVNMVEETFNYAFAPGENNHTYVYDSAEDPFYYSRSWMHFNEDTDLTAYNYESQGWASTTGTGFEDTTIPFSWQSLNLMTTGIFGNNPLLPAFYDFIGSDGSGAVINTTIERRSFSLSFGQNTPVMMDTDYAYFGTLAISGQEFVHLTIASHQDEIDWGVYVIDPAGRFIGLTINADGDVAVLPFRPSVPGTYFVAIEAEPDNGHFAMFDLKPEAVAPTPIAPGQVITDTLPTGEYVLLDSGSFVHDELKPTVRTYKINPGNDVSALTYSFNYPESFLGLTQVVSISMTNDAFIHGSYNGNRYVTGVTFPDTDIYYVRGGVHYITVMGGDNTGYSLYHESDIATDLPINQEFKIDNLFSHSSERIYSLVLEQDSVIKINSTSTSDFTINAWATYDNGYRVSQNIVDGSTLLAASMYYLPAGEYIFDVTVAAYTSEWIEFTIAPITTDLSADVVNVAGFIVPTDPCRQYNLTISLNNLYNVSVPMNVQIYDQFYTSKPSVSPTIGTWFDGSSQIEHSTHNNRYEATLDTRIWSEDYAIILVSTYPYNNTVGVGDYYENYAVNLTIEWEDVTHYNFNGTTTLDAKTSAAHYNFTLGFPGDSSEIYSVFLNTTPGTWYNVSIKTGDVSALTNAYSYAPFMMNTHYTGWGDLSDALQGASPDWSFQFGAISDNIYLEITVSRSLITEGFLWVELIP
ncbi:hypothetical protein EU527_01490, partial [Candidatus Thorarchaeota archaeon]